MYMLKKVDQYEPDRVNNFVNNDFRYIKIYSMCDPIIMTMLLILHKRCGKNSNCVW